MQYCFFSVPVDFTSTLKCVFYGKFNTIRTHLILEYWLDNCHIDFEYNVKKRKFRFHLASNYLYFNLNENTHSTNENSIHLAMQLNFLQRL